MYKRLFNKLIGEINQKEKEYNNVKNKKEDARQDDSKDIEKIVKEFLELEKPTPEIMKVSIIPIMA